MDRFIREATEKGARLVRSHGDRPRLLIVGGVNRPKEIVMNPRKAFSGIKPKYAFCDGIATGLEMNYGEYNEILDRMEGLPGLEGDAGGFETLMRLTRGGLYDGLDGIAAYKWFPDSEDTLFVGAGLSDANEKSDSIASDARKVLRVLKEYVIDTLDFHPHTLKGENYELYLDYYEFLYQNELQYNAYDAKEIMQRIIKEFGMELLEKAKVSGRVKETMKDAYEFNAERETKMGETIAMRMHLTDRYGMGLLNPRYISPDSHIFQPLDRLDTQYVALDLTSPSGK